MAITPLPTNVTIPYAVALPELTALGRENREVLAANIAAYVYELDAANLDAAQRYENLALGTIIAAIIAGTDVDGAITAPGLVFTFGSAEQPKM